MSTLSIPLPKRLPFSGMASPLRPLVHQLMENVHAEGLLAGEQPLRLLEAGSSAGLLSALVLETPLAQRITRIDFADIAPDTLEAAVERSQGWPCRRHYLNCALESLAMPAAYDIVLAWSTFPAGREEAAARAVTMLLKPQGLLLQFQDQIETGRLEFALHRCRLVAARAYAGSGGREQRHASAWIRQGQARAKTASTAG